MIVFPLRESQHSLCHNPANVLPFSMSSHFSTNYAISRQPFKFLACVNAHNAIPSKIMHLMERQPFQIMHKKNYAPLGAASPAPSHADPRHAPLLSGFVHAAGRPQSLARPDQAEWAVGELEGFWPNVVILGMCLQWSSVILLGQRPFHIGSAVEVTAVSVATAPGRCWHYSASQFWFPFCSSGPSRRHCSILGEPLEPQEPTRSILLHSHGHDHLTNGSQVWGVCL